MNPLDPELTRVWNKGREAGKKEATETFYQFLKERMEKLEEIDGVGKKTAFKVHMHFLEAMKEYGK